VLISIVLIFFRKIRVLLIRLKKKVLGKTGSIAHPTGVEKNSLEHTRLSPIPVLTWLHKQ
jgi:hypothetical protein